MISTQQLRVGLGLVGYKVSASRGDVWHIEVAPGTDWTTSKQVGIHVEGETITEMIYGHVDGWPELPRSNLPGETTRDFEWSISVPVKSRVEVVSDTYSYYCISYKDNEPCIPDVVRLASGESFSIPQ